MSDSSKLSTDVSPSLPPARHSRYDRPMDPAVAKAARATADTIMRVIREGVPLPSPLPPVSSRSEGGAGPFE